MKIVPEYYNTSSAALRTYIIYIYVALREFCCVHGTVRLVCDFMRASEAYIASQSAETGGTMERFTAMLAAEAAS